MDCSLPGSSTHGIFQARILEWVAISFSKDLREAEEIRESWQEYTEKLYQKDLNDLDNHDGVVHSSWARHPGGWSQVDLRKHPYEQS